MKPMLSDFEVFPAGTQLAVENLLQVCIRQPTFANALGAHSELSAAVFKLLDALKGEAQ